MAKSRDAFRTISEVSDWLDTPAHVLRFWESRFSQIKPVKRAGGRRYYRPNDMLLLGGIKRLLHDDGITIKGVQKVLREKGVKYVSSLSHDLDTTAEAAPEETPIEAIVDDAPEIATEAAGSAEEITAPDQFPAPEQITPDEITPEPVQAPAFAEPLAQTPAPTDDPDAEPAGEPEEAVEITPEITTSEETAAPSDDRISVLYHRLEALRDRVQAQMRAA